MKGLLTPRQLKRIETDKYDLYEVLVAKHMWHVIKRNQPVGFNFMLGMKHSLAYRYGVEWKFDCLLCELYRDSHGCGACPLGACGIGSPYDEAMYGSVLACEEIIEMIDKDAQDRGVYETV